MGAAPAEPVLARRPETEPARPVAWLPYVLPFALYVVFLAIEGLEPAARVWLYPAKTLVVAAALLAFRGRYEELQPGFSWLALLVGVVVAVLWIFLDPFYPGLSHLTGGTTPASFDPATIADSATRLMFLGFRVAGAVLVVPVMEELFWRAFLIRWLVDQNWKTVPVGAFTARSFAITSVLFAGEHEQWLAGLVCGALLNGLLYRTRSVWACVLAHAVANALLAGWVLSQGAWKLW